MGNKNLYRCEASFKEPGSSYRRNRILHVIAYSVISAAEKTTLYLERDKNAVAGSVVVWKVCHIGRIDID